MVQALRCWIEAFQIASKEDSGWILSPIGELVFSPSSGLDPFLEDHSTNWLLHWLISTNTHGAVLRVGMSIQPLADHRVQHQLSGRGVSKGVGAESEGRFYRHAQAALGSLPSQLPPTARARGEKTISIACCPSSD